MYPAGIKYHRLQTHQTTFNLFAAVVPSALFGKLGLTRSANFTIGYALEKARVVMGEGLVNSEGPLHGRQRRLVQRSFNKQRIAGYATTMATWFARKGLEVDAGELVGDLVAEATSRF